MSLTSLRLFCHAIGVDYEVASGYPDWGHYRLDVEGREWGGEPPALTILPFGRFGNNISQIIHAGHLARSIGSTKIYIDKVNIGALASPLILGGLCFNPLPPPRSETVLSGNFFYPEAFLRQFSGFDGAQRSAIASVIITPMLRTRWSDSPKKSEDVLHIHIRSGDIFAARRVHSAYVPPPLSYYKYAVRHFQQIYPKPKIVLVFEDRHNPCIGPLYDIFNGEGLALSMFGGDFDTAVGELLSARTLITSVGWFAPMIALASTNIRRVYAFRETYNQDSFLAKGTNIVLVRDADGRYIQQDAWANSPDQINQMIDYPEAALRIG